MGENHLQKLLRGAAEWHKNFAKTEEGKLFYKKLGQINSKKNIESVINGKFHITKSGNPRYKRGRYYSEIYKIDFTYDSIWELHLIKFFEKEFKKGYIKSFDRCRIYFKYKTNDGTTHRYIPDFYVEFKNGIKVIIEIKPSSFLKKDPRGILLLKKISAKKNSKKDNIKYITLTEKELYETKNIKYHSKYTNKIKSDFNIFDYII